MALNAQSVRRSAYEIMVVDDGSSDATSEIAGRSAGVRLLQIPHRGAAAARNAGIREARGEILLFTDADCEPDHRWIEEMLAPFKERDIAGAKGTYRTTQREWVARFVQLEYEEKYARMQQAESIDFIDTYSAAYCRDVFIQNGGFDETFPNAAVEDQEFSFRLHRKGYRMTFAPNAIVRHHHPSTLLAYLRRKFRVGYWKVRVIRRYPGKVWSDAHTPPSLKLETLLFPSILASAAAGFLLPAFWFLAFALATTFLLVSLPLLGFVARRDRTVAFAAPLFILARAGALSLGFAVGILAELVRSPELKRLIDIMGAVVFLLLCAPIMLIIAFLIKADSSGPILFIQMRIGRDGKPFRMFKFRSMVNNAETMLPQVMAGNTLPPPVFKVENDPRITRIGKWLRRLSLDELPQLMNVLRGEMSLVGPRPEEPRVVEQYNSWQRLRLAVKPGITGPMQTDGRARLSLDERVQLELDYINRYSIWQDVVILAKTIPAVIRGTGAY